MMPFSAMRLRSTGSAGSIDPFWSDVVSLLHFDGPDGSIAFVDQKGVAWRRAGTTEIDTDESKFGGASLLLPGGSALLANAPGFAFGTGDYTVEMWWRLASAGGVNANIAYWGASSDNGVPAAGLYERAAGGLVAWATSDRVTAPGVVGTAFRHIAVCRSAGTARLFSDGQLRGSWADSINYTGQNVKVGRFGDTNYTPRAHCDDLRITRAARYTADFIPPAAPFPNS